MDEIFEQNAPDTLFLRPGKEAVVIQPFQLYLLSLSSNSKDRNQDGLKERFRGDFDKDILDCIATKRLQLAFLLNSKGGGEGIELQLKEIINYVRAGGGDVFAFGKKRVHSLAAEILVEAHAEKRYIAHDTEIMFHLPVWGEMNAEKTGDKEHLEKVLLFSIKPKMRDEMKKKWEHALAQKNVRSDCAVYLTAEEAVELGLAKTPMNLQGEFNNASRITSSKYNGTSIEEFFEA